MLLLYGIREENAGEIWENGLFSQLRQHRQGPRQDPPPAPDQ